MNMHASTLLPHRTIGGASRDRGGAPAEPRLPGADVGRIRPAVPRDRSAIWGRARHLRDGRERTAGARRQRSERCAPSGPGEGPHVIQLAGREAHWMAEGARAATDAGADIIDINMGCPAKKVTGGYSGSALMRDLDHALRLIEATVGGDAAAGDAEDAARLGRAIAERRRTCPARRTGGRAARHRAWTHALPVLHRHGRLGRDPGGEGRGVHPGHRQWRPRLPSIGSSRCSSSRAPTA